MLIGRCADYILKGRPDVVRVFVHADAAFCLQEAMKIDSMPEDAVARKIAEIDEYRAKMCIRDRRNARRICLLPTFATR